jgi:hypothetical protein
MITRRAPASTPNAAWNIVANVIPQAPAASCISNSSGDMVVLPCGASATPLRDA